jgi:iron complex transport system permease protein
LPRRAALTLAGLFALLALAVLLRLLAGDWRWPAGDILDLRLHRAVSAAVVGAALAAAGVMLQSLLRNPLASPDLLGLASGAGLAVMLATYLHHAAASGPAVLPAAATAGAALAGSLVTLTLVYILSQRRGFLEPVSLVLVGVIVSVMCGAATMFIAQLLPDRGFGVARWTIGALDDSVPWPRVLAIGAVTLAGTAVGVSCGRAMDAASLSEDEARSVGVPLGALRITLFAAAGVLTAGAVVLAGPIGFVGLVCPHVVRLLAGPSHGPLVLGAAIAGAILMLAADTGVRALDIASGRMPIGIITALVGGPVFILLLRRETRGQ